MNKFVAFLAILAVGYSAHAQEFILLTSEKSLAVSINDTDRITRPIFSSYQEKDIQLSSPTINGKNQCHF